MAGEEGQNQEVVNIISLEDSLKKKDDDPKSPLVTDLCIYRVPYSIRSLSAESYDPYVVSIGPFHSGDKRFESMEAFKMRYYHKVVERSNNEDGAGEYIEYLKGCEAKARQCYSEVFKQKTDDFVKILLIDCFFIIELLLCNSFPELRNNDHTILTSTRLALDIRRDLLLLENQIPFFVLQGLYNLATRSYTRQPAGGLLALIFTYFNDKNVQNRTTQDISSIKHFTDLVLRFNWPAVLRIEPTNGEFQTIKTATMIDEAGVTFKMSDSKCLLDVKFNKGILEIPKLTLHGDQKSFMQNLMALEHCHYKDRFITHYFLFMHYLVHTSKDVDILVENGIINRWTGDKTEMALLINKMSQSFVVGPEHFYFANLCRDLSIYSKSWLRRSSKSLCRDYFGSPWRGLSTGAAFALLILTLLQTIKAF